MMATNIGKIMFCYIRHLGSGRRLVGRRSVSRGDGGSIPPTAVSKLRQFRSPHICLCLSEKTLRAVGVFYLLSVQEEVKDTIRKCIICSGLTKEGQFLR